MGTRPDGGSAAEIQSTTLRESVKVTPPSTASVPVGGVASIRVVRASPGEPDQARPIERADGHRVLVAI